MPSIEEIEKVVLSLPVGQRALLAESLLNSLSASNPVCSEADDLAEEERREREIEEGKVQPLTEPEFWKRVQEIDRR
jgi:hypothetical protein